MDCQKRKWKILCNCKTYICVVSKLKHTGEVIGIDLGLKNLATLSNELEIANLDIKREETMIKKYQKKLSRQEYMSNNYKKNPKKIPQMAKQKKITK